MEIERKILVKRVLMALAACGGALALAGCSLVHPVPQAEAADPPQKTAPMSALGSYLAARHAQQEFEYGDAAAFMNHALAGDPNNFDLIRRTFVLRVSEGRVADAVALARQIIDLDRDSGLAGLVLMVEDIKSGDYDAVAQRAQSVPRDGAQRFAVPLLLAWAELGRQHPAPALAALDSMGDLHGLQPLRDLHAALIEDYADRVPEAEAAYRKLVPEGSRPTWRVVEAVGNFDERRGHPEQARALYENFKRGIASAGDAHLVDDGLQRIAQGKVPQPLIRTPRDGAAEALFDLAGVLNQRETIDAALIFARLALELQPKFALAQLLVGEIEEAQGHTADALAQYQSVDPSTPLSWSARLRAASALDRLNRTDEAVAQLNAMAAERPDRWDALVELGDLQRGHNKFDAAVIAYDGAIPRVGKLEPGSWRLFYSRGVALERAGQWPRAEADFKHALELQPEQPLVLNYLGYSWIDKGENLSEALKMIQRAVELRPNDGYIVDSLGWAYFRLGDFSRATQFLERATELLPEDPTINDHLGDAYWRSNRIAEARYQWRRALQFKPEADEIKNIEGKLDRGLGSLPAAMNGR